MPRHKFVDEALSSRAYEDTALPIGQSQTISQPWIVARMTEALLQDEVPHKVLEVGTGSGYQAAVLAQLVPEVFTVERIRELSRSARQLFHVLRHEQHSRAPRRRQPGLAQPGAVRCHHHHRRGAQHSRGADRAAHGLAA